VAEPVFDPDYWRVRLARSIDREQAHHAVFEVSEERWRKIAAKHRDILRGKILPSDSILDAGCGWGRLLSLLPKEWKGEYVGVDLSPDFIRVATAAHPSRHFLVGDLREPLGVGGSFSWAILISIRQMVIANVGGEAWAEIEANLRAVARRLLVLEYDSDAGGVVL
jgi:SAM-dependent methyltransferase